MSRKFLSLDLYAASLQAGTIKDTDDVVVLQTATPKIRALDDAESEGTPRIEFIITDASIDRENDTIAIDGWNLDEYKRNPVVLWAHSSRDLPIGKAVTLERNLDQLRSVAEFTPQDVNPFGHMCYRLYKAGFLHAVSVGFRPTEYSYDPDRGYGINFLKQTLLEYSAVPVPANPNALAVARSAGIDLSPYASWAEQLLDEGDTSEEHRDRLVAVRSMARVGGRPVILAMGAWARAAATELKKAAETTTAPAETIAAPAETIAPAADAKAAADETTADESGATAERATIPPVDADPVLDLDSHARSFVDVLGTFRTLVKTVGANKASAVPEMHPAAVEAVRASALAVVDALDEMTTEAPADPVKEVSSKEGEQEEAGVIVIDDTPDPDPMIRASESEIADAIREAVAGSFGQLTGKA